MSYKYKIHVDWSEPVPVNEARAEELANENGVYFITKEYIRHGQEWEDPIYVGLTTRNFDVRLYEHQKHESEWTKVCPTIRKTVRFGTIRAYRIDTYDLKLLYEDVETSIIQKIYEKYPNSLVNVMKKNSAQQNYEIEIIHHGNFWFDEKG